TPAPTPHPAAGEVIDTRTVNLAIELRLTRSASPRRGPRCHPIRLAHSRRGHGGRRAGRCSTRSPPAGRGSHRTKRRHTADRHVVGSHRRTAAAIPSKTVWSYFVMWPR